MNKKVSIVIPVYNVEKYLVQCIESAVNQTLKEIEIILVDDGSTDSSGIICDEYANKDTRIKVIHKDNGGLSDARNAGANIAEGKYIYFLDSDDWIEKYSMESLFIYAEQNELDMVLFDARVVDENGIDYLDITHYMRYYRIGNYDGVVNGPEIFRQLISHKEYYSSIPLLFIKRKALVIRFENMLHEDELFTIQLLYNLDRVAYYPELLYVRRIRRGSIMTIAKTVNHYRGMQTVVEQILRIENKDATISRYACTLLQCSELIYSALSRDEKKIVRKDKERLIKGIKQNGDYGFKRLEMVTKFLPFYPFYNVVFNKENSFACKLMSRVMQHENENNLLKGISTCNARRIFIIGVPTHGNLGDHAIAISQLDLLNCLFPDTEIVEIDRTSYVHRKNIFKRVITDKDIIIIPGGGWLGNQWYHNEIMVEDVVRRFPNNKIIILPQTIYFEECAERDTQIDKAKEIFSNNKLLLFCRDKKSLEFARDNLNVESRLAPDLVLRLETDFALKRSGILICFRDDCERIVDANEKTLLINWIKNLYVDVKFSTTVIGHIPLAKRRFAVEKKLREFARSELVVTDRLHAMIFAAITGTPCVAFDNASNKVSGVYEWIKHLGYIKVVNDIEEAKEWIGVLKNKHNHVYDSPSFGYLQQCIIDFINN